ncbi:hypothetical protein BH10PAT1_BH10PAT1_2160 [soil metagenome]
MKKLKKNWKKIVLAIMAVVVGLVVVVVTGLFLWMQTWKAFQLWDRQGYFLYPSNWIIKENKSTDIQTYLTINYSASENYSPIIINRYNSLDHKPEEIVQSYKCDGPSYQFQISGEKAYSKICLVTNGYYLAGQEIDVKHNNYIYNLEFAPTQSVSKFTIIDQVLFRLILFTIHFN